MIGTERRVCLGYSHVAVVYLIFQKMMRWQTVIHWLACNSVHQSQFQQQQHVAYFGKIGDTVEDMARSGLGIQLQAYELSLNDYEP